MPEGLTPPEHIVNKPIPPVEHERVLPQRSLHQLAVKRTFINAEKYPEVAKKVLTTAQENYEQSAKDYVEKIAKKSEAWLFRFHEGNEYLREEFEHIESVSREHLIQKHQRLGLPFDHIADIKPNYLQETFWSITDKKRAKSGWRIGYVTRSHGLVLVHADYHDFYDTIPHEVSHGSVLRTEVYEIKHNQVHGEVIRPFSGVLEEGFARWDSLGINEKLIEQNQLPEHTMKQLKKDHEQLLQGVHQMSESYNYKDQDNAARELVVMRKLAGLVGYYNTENPDQKSNEELMQRGRDLLERMRHSQDQHKGKTFKQELRKIKGLPFIRMGAFDDLLSFLIGKEGHPESARYYQVIDPFKNAEKKINRKF